MSNVQDRMDVCFAEALRLALEKWPDVVIIPVHEDWMISGVEADPEAVAAFIMSESKRLFEEGWPDSARQPE